MNAITQRDRTIVRRLAEQQAEIAALPVHRQTIRNWQRLNRLEKVKPLVFIYPGQVPWHELDVDDELTLQARDGFCRDVEQELRRTLYMWRHLRGDMVVEPTYRCPLVIHDSGFGIAVQEDTAPTDAANDVVGHRYHPQMGSAADIEKIQTPRVTYDAEATERNYQRLQDLLGDTLRVEKRGAAAWYVSPVDELFTWWGIQEAFLDLALRPELFHQAMERLTQAHLARLAQYEQLGLFSPGNGNVLTGQGGLGYTDELPQPDAGGQVRPIDLWGSAMAQIFAGVSPQMHEEFALRYEIRVLERFGLNYYGCCEPLHRKVEVVRSIPRLRKISMSPFVDVDQAVQAVGDRLVFSRKPSPAIFTADGWDPDWVRQELRAFLQRARGCVVELILKDVSTVRYQPRRLWEWARIASEVTEEFA